MHSFERLHRMRVFLLAPVAAVTLVLAACSGEKSASDAPKSAVEGLAITEARLVLPLVSDNPAAVYFTLANQGDAPQQVKSVSVEGAGMTMVHETVDVGGHSKMQMAENVVVPAKGTVEFAPGGKHVMVTGLKPELKANAKTVLTIDFDSGAKASAELPVIAAATGN